MLFRIGGLLAVLGLGSAALHFTSIQFRLLIWAEPAQPFLGLGLGAAGVALIVFKLANNNRSASGHPQQQFPPQPGMPHGGHAYPPQQPPYGGAPHAAPGYGQPPMGAPQYAPQQYPQQQFQQQYPPQQYPPHQYQQHQHPPQQYPPHS